MSMGPEIKKETSGFGTFERIRHTVKQMVEAYFTNPIHYLWYGMLTATFIGLYVGHEFSNTYYVMLILLACLYYYTIIYPLNK